MARSARVLPCTGTVADFQRDGAVVLRQVLDAAEVARLAQGIEHNLAHPSALAMVRPICATSSECVTRVRYRSPSWFTKTWVLYVRRRKAFA